MYALVGCKECSALWVVADRPETTSCPRCGKRHRYEKLKRFVTTDDEDHAREVRASMLANRQGEGDAFADLDSFAALEDQVDEAGVSDAEYLEGSGLDADEVAAAGDRASRSRHGGGGRSRRDVVLGALDDLDAPTEDEVVEYAAEEGVDGEYVRRCLTKLRRAGEVTENGGRYRPL